MPGIVGIISRRSPPECEGLVESMVDSMKHERFYTSGTYAAPKMGVYCGWVALKGSSATDQPFLSNRQDIALILAGECPGDSPGGLLNLYEKEEDQFFGKLNGLFSGLVIDSSRNQAFLFNDRYGGERIYWHKTRDAFYFASEAKALLQILPELRGFDPAGVAQFCAFGCTFNWKTLFRDVHLLPGGSVYTFKEGTCSKRQYFDSKNWESLPVLSIDSFEAKFEETFKRILPRYFESSLKIAISLTGGLDTRMIMACGPLHPGSPLSYTFTGRKGETLDDRIAGQVAEACQLSHRLVRLNHAFFSDFAYHADRGVYLTDGCLGIT